MKTILIIISYFLLGIFFNLVGPLNKRLKEEFKKIDAQKFASKILRKKTKKYTRGKIIIRVMTIILFPFFLVIAIISDIQDKQKKLQDNKDTNLSEKRGLFFSYINGIGYLTCKDCGNKQEILAFMHSIDSSTTGYQCQDCGHFQKVFSYKHQATNIPRCEKCGGTLSRDEPIFCQVCKSKNVEYKFKIMS